ncbi:MAG: XRE family transcriptional regulator [Deltaproteobacteria bacterium]|nr:XRE family transcriptional regulator [Deltaproteobacteria bacterium]
MRRNDITRSTGNVFADLGLDAPDELLAKAALMSKVAALVSERKLTQKAAAKLLGIDQPKVSALMNGKLSLFSTERLMEFLTALGNDVEIVVRKRAKSRGPGRIQVVSAPA